MPDEPNYILNECISKLKPREQDIIIKRYGPHCTLDLIGKEYGVTRERVRQIEKRALKKLKRLYNNHKYMLKKKKTNMEYRLSGSGAYRYYKSI